MLSMTSGGWDKFLQAKDPQETFLWLKSFVTDTQTKRFFTPKAVKKLYESITGHHHSEISSRPCLFKVFRELRCLAAAALLKMTDTVDYLSIFLQYGLIKVIISTFAEFTEHTTQERPLDYPQIALLEQLSLLTQKVTYLTDMPNEDVASKVRLVELLIKICDTNNRNIFHFSPRSRDHLQELTKGKVLIGQFHSLSLEQSSHHFKEVFSTYSIDWQNNVVLNPNAHSVDLYDTTDADDVCIRDELLKSHAVWPLNGDDVRDSHEEADWLDLQVTEVISAGQFWAHVGDDVQEHLQKIESKLRNWPMEKREKVLRRQLYHFVCIPPSYTDGRGYCRGQIIADVVEADDELIVFAFDHGFVVRVKCTDMFYLNAEMNLKGVGPQCQLCCIKDTSAPPISTDLVATSLAILMNICKDVRLSDVMRSSSNIQILRQLHLCPDLKLKTQSLKLLCNMAHQLRVRDVFTKLGMIEDIVGLIKEYLYVEDASELLLCAVTCLSNIIYNNEAGKGAFKHIKGGAAVLQLLDHSCSEVLHKACFRLLCIYTTTATTQPQARQPKDEPVNKDTRRAQRSRSRSRNRSEDECSHVSLNRDRLSREHSSDEESSEPYRQSNTDHLRVPVDVAAEYYLDNKTCYVRGACVTFRSDETHELNSTTDISRVSGKIVGTMASAFLNSGKGGSLFYGINTDGYVEGIHITRNERDEFRLGFDREMGRMNPFVMHDLFEVHYHPVVRVTSGNAGRVVVEDFCVLEIQFHPTTVSIYRTRDNIFYLRKGAKTFQVRTQDVQKMVHEREEEKYQTDIEKLMAQITELEQQI